MLPPIDERLQSYFDLGLTQKSCYVNSSLDIFDVYIDKELIQEESRDWISGRHFEVVYY